MPPKVYVTSYPARRLPRHAGARRRPRAAEVGHVVPREPGQGPADGDRARAALRHARRARSIAVLDAAAVTALRTAAAAVIAAETLCRAGRRDDRGDRLRRQRRRDGADVPRARQRRPALGHRSGAGRVRRRSPRRHASRRRSRRRSRATSSSPSRPGRELLYPAGSLRDGQHVSMMGADGPGKAEVAVAELARADLFCDDWEQASHGGELAAGVVAGVVTRDRVTDIGRVLAGDAEGRRSAATSRCSTRPGSRSRISRSPRRRSRRPTSSICQRSDALSASASTRRSAAAPDRNSGSRGSPSPSTARATSSPQAKPSTLPWPE